MRTKQEVLISGVILLALAGLPLAQGQSEPKIRTEPAPAQATAAPVSGTNLTKTTDLPVIGSIERRGRTIIIKSGPKGPIYPVKTTEGRLLFENPPAEQLRAQAPELHEFIKTAVAGGSSKNRVVVDASVHASN